jgi:outer membrane receptor protein involved in Fe transport
MIRKSAFLASAGLMAVATPAFAQTVPLPTNESGKPTTAPPTESSTAQTAAVQTQAVEQQPVDTGNIIITATRRNQALSDVPMAVSAVTAENLRNTGATDIRQLNQVAPSLLVSSTSSEGGAAVARIRGIGTVGDNPGLEGSVGLFIDGVYRSRAGVGLTELGPLDRIEVLRGPQGTLFGRNTSAGLISIITAKPRFTPEVSGQVDIGNYNLRRVQGSATGPVSDTVAVRLDGVYLKRSGFLKDVISGRRVNDRDRWLLRGQVLYQPSDNLSLRIIGDYSKRSEECCGATYLPAQDVTAAGSQPSTIAGIERALGAVINDDTFSRKMSITPGRDYDSRVRDWGLSGELNYDLGAAQLTSITAYRYNKYVRGQDADFNNLDLLYRASDGGSFNRFKTFSQELRLQGDAWNNRIDWLIGGYYANEKLAVDDNLAYGNDYARYGNCLVAANFVAGGSPATLLAPGASPTCFNTPVASGVRASLVNSYNAAAAGAAAAAAAGNAALAASLSTTAANVAGSIAALSAFARLPNSGLPASIPLPNFSVAPFGNSGYANLTSPALTLNNVALDDSYRQTSNNWALFTHNIISFTDRLKLTLGARYTHEKKSLDALLLDNNTICGLLSGTSLQQYPCVIPSAAGGTLNINDSRSESKLSGTAVLSYKPTDRLLTYASYSRGYKAGGFNLDRSALWRAQAIPTTVPATPGTAVLGNPPLSGSGAICTSVTQKGCQGIVASGGDLQFRPEINDAFEAGFKYHGRGIDVNLALFHQVFRDFQLNTFNGLNFIVETINSCSTDLNGADADNNPRTGACTGNTRAGVRSQGFELEAFTRPMTDLSLNGGVTMADTKYRTNLVGAGGKALNDYLFQLPGRRLSNAPLWTITGSAAWTPPIGSSGLRGLIYFDGRYMSSYNTGSDLDIEKTQKGFATFNGRVGVHGPDDSWAIEFWGQNLFNKNSIQVAFDAPLQGSGTTRAVQAGFIARSTQLYGAFLGEPRTFGLTLRAKTGFARPAAPAYVPPPAPPPVVEQPAPPPPPPPPPPPAPAPERGS